MTEIARIFMHGRSQAVRLPKEFRLPGAVMQDGRQKPDLPDRPLDFD